ncbi:matrixin family metalloprotease [Asaia sp. As-1742]|uniref:matrixin family metalloprotease n=1 Tax=Asaia sp. As-1742 TaxID=2608325 RepID=UPI0014204F2F|nr:matrixin family metalloprotease [Asaia sp. As-1742]NIE80037.1 matrixin family metalloprotease [Asaia sp. As-1742]
MSDYDGAIKAIGLLDGINQLSAAPNNISIISGSTAVAATVAEIANPVAGLSIGEANMVAQVAQLSVDIKSDAGWLSYGDDALGMAGQAAALAGSGIALFKGEGTIVGDALTVFGNSLTLASFMMHSSTGSNADSAYSAVQDTIQAANQNYSVNIPDLGSVFGIPVLDGSGNIAGVKMEGATGASANGNSATYNFSDGTTVTIPSTQLLNSNFNLGDMTQTIDESGANGSSTIQVDPSTGTMTIRNSDGSSVNYNETDNGLQQNILENYSSPDSDKDFSEQGVVDGREISDTLNGNFGILSEAYGNLSLGDNASGSIVGQGNTVDGGANDALTVDGASDAITNGNGGTITLSGATDDTFNPGSNVTVNINPGSDNNTFNMQGTRDVVNVGGSSEDFNGHNSGANEETFSFGDNVGNDTLDGSADTAILGNGSGVTFQNAGYDQIDGNGNGEHLNVDPGSDNDSFDLVGTGDTIDVGGSSDTFNGHNSGANEETFSFGDNVGNDTLDGSADTAILGNGSGVTFQNARYDQIDGNGSNEHLNVDPGSDNDSFDLVGTGDTIDVGGSSDTFNGHNSGANAENFTFNDNVGGDTLDGNDDTATLGNGSGVTFYNAGGDQIDGNGSNEHLNVDPGSNNDSFDLVGTGDTIYVGGSNDTFNGHNSGANAENFTFGDNVGGDVVTGSDLTIDLGDNMNLTVTGSNDRFTGGSNDTLEVLGSEDYVDTDDGNIDFSDGDDDHVSGDGDDQAGGDYDDLGKGTENGGRDDEGDDDGGDDGGDGMDDGLVAADRHYTNVFSSSDKIASSAAWDRADHAITAAAEDSDSDATALTGQPLTGTAQDITWSFAQKNPGDTPLYAGSVQPVYQDAIKQALAEWSTATGLTFTNVADSASSDIRIGWGNLDTTNSGMAGTTFYGKSSDGKSGQDVIELENPMQDKLFATSDGGYTYDGTGVTLEQLALHEVGHALGLSESSDPNAIMFPELGNMNTGLDQTDVNEVKGVYHLTSDTGVTDLLRQASAAFTDGGAVNTSAVAATGETFDNPLLIAHAA